MKLTELMRDIAVPVLDTEIQGITCDSRRVRPGWAFVCIRGTAADGHRFARQAQENGAAVIVAQEDTGCENQLLVSATRPGEDSTGRRGLLVVLISKLS